MSYTATCTFDLKNASREDYQDAYGDLERLGLKRVVVSAQGNRIVMPTTMTIGDFSGRSSAAVRDHVRAAVKDAFSARGFTSEIFVVVGENGTWGAITT